VGSAFKGTKAEVVSEVSPISQNSRAHKRHTAKEETPNTMSKQGENYKENLSYQVIITGADGRFGTEIIEGGLNKKTALFEAKRAKEQGRIVKIFDKQNRKFL